MLIENGVWPGSQGGDQGGAQLEVTFSWCAAPH